MGAARLADDLRAGRAQHHAHAVAAGNGRIALIWQRGQPMNGSAGQKKRRTAVTGDADDLETRLQQLESERDELARRLQLAEERVRLLEERQKAVLDRIDWVIDSLHNAMEIQT